MQDAFQRLEGMEGKQAWVPSGREGEVELRSPVYGVFQKGTMGSSLVVQWLRLLAPTARVPGQGTRSHMLQLKPSIAKYIYIYIKGNGY